MDPDAVLIRLLDAIEAEDAAGAAEAAMDFAQWIHQGGFLPAVTTIHRWSRDRLSP